MATAVYPGSFDPVTLGHLNIIERVTPMFDDLIVLVANDHEKKYFFSPTERKILIEKSLPKGAKVKVDIWDGLTVDYLAKVKAKYLIRGIRSVSDFDHEWVMFNMNKKLNSKVDSVFIPADSEYNFISSRAMKEVAIHGGELEPFVPAAVAKAVREKIKEKSRK